MSLEKNISHRLNLLFIYKIILKTQANKLKKNLIK